MPFSDAFKRFPILQTSRLILDELVAEDAEAYHRRTSERKSVSARDRIAKQLQRGILEG
jgi:hypothetical protein